MLLMVGKIQSIFYCILLYLITPYNMALGLNFNILPSIFVFYLILV